MAQRQMKVCQLFEAVPGMRLGQPVRSDSGAVLLPEDSILTHKAIGKLALWGVRRIVICQEQAVAVPPDADDVAFAGFYQDSLYTTRQMFAAVERSGKIPLRECLNVVEILLTEIIGRAGVLRRLRQVKKSDVYTFNHSLNVSVIATLLGQWLGLTGDVLNRLALAGLLHDIGKARVPASILAKPGTLTAAEMTEMRKHSIYSYQLLGSIPGLHADVGQGVLQHHEREDGRGYPLGLRDGQIHLFGKIIAVADIYDAMTSDRVYRRHVSPYHVAELIAEDSFGKLDTKVAQTFLANIANSFTGNVVRLSTGETGEVVYINPQHPTRPIVRIGDKCLDLTAADVVVTEVLEE